MKYHLHSLRHFFASWAIAQGFSPKRLQALFGHSSIQMTFDTYGHLLPSLEGDHAKFAAGELQIRGRRGAISERRRTIPNAQPLHRSTSA